MKVKKGELITLEIEDLAFGGSGIGHAGGKVIFVENAIPGQLVNALIRKNKPTYAKAICKEVLRKSKDEVEPPCMYFHLCGGCTLLNLGYKQQLALKQKQVEEIYRHLGGIKDIPILPILGCRVTSRYRNKMEFTFSPRKWHTADDRNRESLRFALGFHKPRIFDKVIDIEKCYLQPEIGDRILNLVRKSALENQLQPYDTRSHEGFLRHLVLRFGVNTGQLMVNIVTREKAPEKLLPIQEVLLGELPDITSLVNNINTRKAAIALGEEELILAGQDFIEEKLGNLRFKISANSFFQTNSYQAEELYRVVRELASLSNSETVWDLYCGTGAISLFLAGDAMKVIGLELIQTAVKDARENARRNNITNVEFHVCDLNRVKKTRERELLQSLPPPDLIILDPPRSGAHPELMKMIAELQGNIIYVSCNPTTQVRDLTFLLEKGWKVDLVQPVDMFPHTYHIECVTRLSKN